MNEAMDEPRLIYSQLLEERRRTVAAQEARHRKLGYAKLAALAGVLAVILAALIYRSILILWVLAPAAVFVALIVIHEQLLTRLELGRRAVRYFERALARLDGNWPGTGESGQAYLDAAHPYAQDLDLFGKGSVFELLCTARTHIGEETLARWLLHPAAPATVRERQQAADELRPRVDLREDLAILAEEARTGVDPVSLAAWGEAPPLLQGRWLGLKAAALTVLGVSGLAAFLIFDMNQVSILHLSERTAALLRDWFLIALLANGYFMYRVHERVSAVVSAVEESAHGLALLSHVLLRIERERFRSPLLERLRALLDVNVEPVSRRLARLNRVMQHLDSREHLVVRVLEPFLLWTYHGAIWVERWRRHSGPAVRQWLTASGEIEALCSLASHAFEHPGDPFPEFTETLGFHAEGIGHPLLLDSQVVRNDVELGGDLRVLVVSGSNMSGKSTLLRTLGVNAVLAQAGATVRARRLVLSPLAVGASIHVVDSLQGGVSRFYAEILRIRQILDQTGGPLPVLFLIDEFLHGTNSHDRRIGAEALVRGLVDRGALGLITTHDLALAHIAETLAPRAANVHFEDQLEDGRMRFDYVMRPGVVRKSNAIELMRSVGLQI